MVQGRRHPGFGEDDFIVGLGMTRGRQYDGLGWDDSINGVMSSGTTAARVGHLTGVIAGSGLRRTAARAGVQMRSLPAQGRLFHRFLYTKFT
jgi:hypothetical protein